MTKCIIVDDEEPARDLLAMYIQQISSFEIVGRFENAFAAFSHIQNHPVELMFLDIQMPKMTGIQLFRSLQNPPKVIFTTAFREYALEGFDLDAIDYLLKPISQDRFFKAISKFHFYNHIQIDNAIPSKIPEEAYLFLKVGKDQVKISLEDILYIEGLKDYIKVFTKQKMLVAYERMTYMAEKLPESKFIRVHKSYIVSLGKISHFNQAFIYLDNLQIPIGRVYKQAFQNIMKESNPTKI